MIDTTSQRVKLFELERHVSVKSDKGLKKHVAEAYSFLWEYQDKSLILQSGKLNKTNRTAIFF